MRATLIGTESILATCGEQLLERGHEIVRVFTRDPAIAGWAADLGCPVSELGPGTGEQIRADATDWLFSIGNLDIVSDEILAAPKIVAVNFHDAPLPRYVGVNTPVWGLLNDETEWGISFHVMTSGIDEGHVLAETRFAIADDETAFTLNAKCYESAIGAFGPLIDRLAGGDIVGTPQPPTDERLVYRRADRPSAGAVVDWRRDASSIVRLVRALQYGHRGNPVGLAKLLLPSPDPESDPASAGAAPSISAAKRARAETAVVVVSARVLDERSQLEPGTVVEVAHDRLVVATGTTDVEIVELTCLRGAPIELSRVAETHGLREGTRLPVLDDERADRLTAHHTNMAKGERHHVRQLATFEPVDLPYAQRSGDGAQPLVDGGSVDLLPGFDADGATALIALVLARLSGRSSIDLAYASPEIDQVVAAVAPLAEPVVAVRCSLDLDRPWSETAALVTEALAAARRRGPSGRELVARHPELASAPPPTAIVVRHGAPAGPAPAEVARRDGFGELDEILGVIGGVELVFDVAADARTVTIRHDPSAYPRDAVARIRAHLGTLAHRAAVAPATAAGDLPLLNDADLHRILVEWNDTAVHHEPVCIHERIAAQAARTPDATALVCGAARLTYRELDERANVLAHRLQKLGVAPGSLVGIHLDRTADLVVSVLAVHKAGGAYVPLDPTYPDDRIAYMVAHSGLSVLCTHERLLAHLPPHEATIVVVDRPGTAELEDPEDRAGATGNRSQPPGVTVGADDLAYVIYTSGSTGKPKGVMVEHHNLSNFVLAMDPVIPHGPAGHGQPGVWLAVTSLSFDISILELLYTLARGFTVVVHPDTPAKAALSPVAAVAATGPVHTRTADALHTSPRPLRRQRLDFSLFYFAADESEPSASSSRYRLLIDGARYADANGYTAVWTPERHFHAFGGLYPNPAVTGAALAMVTENVEIRAGSCVLPLHSPIRVAEEWSLVDNLSGGRTGLAIASGWHPNDFVFQPQNFSDAKGVMVRSIETLRRLWGGESVTFDGPDGRPVDVRTLPRPIRPEVPLWITTAGSPESFRLAGRIGCHLLTHLLGQDLAELTAKIALYRQARREAGHPGEGHVTLMLHTLVGDDDAAVKEAIHRPLVEYLRSSTSLVAGFAWAFPTFKNRPGDARDDDLSHLEPDEVEALLEFAFQRYSEGSGLFGTPESCQPLLESLVEMGVDEIGCLVDFGVDENVVLESLPRLTELKEWAARRFGPAPDVAAVEAVLAVVAPTADAIAEDETIGEAIVNHGVTHFQCTPSQARMILADPANHEALTHLHVWLIGGEAFPPALAAELAQVCPTTRIVNVYGPTETTIWSSSHAITGAPSTVLIGRPIANTNLYILDGRRRPVPVGVPGELWIGGEGVTRGYLGRPDLTVERFVPDPFVGADANPHHARMYCTGDVARWCADGAVECLGRTDHQVKVRGYRIELGEIEAVLAADDAVREAVVVAREDVPGDVRLVGYVVVDPHAPSSDGPGSGASTTVVSHLRERCRAQLPDYMVPAHVVVLARFPQTPNGKIDRLALPAPTSPAARPPGSSPARARSALGAGASLEAQIAELWSETLGLEHVDVTDNFFDLGGHSMLAVRVHRRLRDELGFPVSLTDLFRFPTVRQLAGFLGAADADDDADAKPAAVNAAQARGEARRLARQRIRVGGDR